MQFKHCFVTYHSAADRS